MEILGEIFRKETAGDCEWARFGQFRDQVWSRLMGSWGVTLELGGRGEALAEEFEQGGAEGGVVEVQEQLFRTCRGDFIARGSRAIEAGARLLCFDPDEREAEVFYGVVVDGRGGD